MKRQHKHAEMIRQWLDDDSLEVEMLNSHGNWSEAWPNWSEDVTYRFKPRMIKCGDLEFPEPMRVAPPDDTKYWTAEIHANYYGVSQVDEWTWGNDTQDKECLKAGICHLTSEAAEAHARALIALTEVKP